MNSFSILLWNGDCSDDQAVITAAIEALGGSVKFDTGMDTGSRVHITIGMTKEAVIAAVPQMEVC